METISIFVNVNTYGYIIECTAGSDIVPDKNYNYAFEKRKNELTSGYTADIFYSQYKVENGQLVAK